MSKLNVDWPSRKASKQEREEFFNERYPRSRIARALGLGDPEPLIEKLAELGFNSKAVTEVLRYEVGHRSPGRREKIVRVRISDPNPKAIIRKQKLRVEACVEELKTIKMNWRRNVVTMTQVEKRRVPLEYVLKILLVGIAGEPPLLKKYGFPLNENVARNIARKANRSS